MSAAGLREVAERLVARLEEVHASAAYSRVWYVHQAHCGPYAGPTYTDELAAARAALDAEEREDRTEVSGALARLAEWVEERAAAPRDEDHHGAECPFCMGELQREAIAEAAVARDALAAPPAREGEPEDAEAEALLADRTPMSDEDLAEAREVQKMLAGEGEPGDGEGALLPCPWCGKPPAVIEDDSYGLCTVGCLACAPEPYVSRPKDELAEALAAWNRRSAPPAAAPPELREALQQARDFIAKEAQSWVYAGGKQTPSERAILATVDAALAAPPPEPEAGGTEGAP